MRYFQRVSLALFVGFWISASGPVQAQEDWKEEPKSMVIADVMLTDVVSSEELGVVSGSFTLTGNMGQENGITYGVAVFDAKDRTLLDGKRLGGPISLFQGEGRRFDFQYVLPDWLSGEVSVTLFVENDRGVLLGARELVKKTVSGTGPSFSCHAIDGEQPSISCESSQGAELVAKYTKNSPLGEKFGETRLGTESGESSVVTLDLSPGQYFAFVSDPTGKTVIVPLRVKGAYGQIKNISVAHRADGIPEATVLVYGSALGDTSLSLEAKEKDGTICFTESRVLVDPVFRFKLKENCTEGTVIATLKSKEGAILDEVAEPFSILSFSAGSGEATNPVRGDNDVPFSVVKLGLFFLIGLGILIFGIQWFRKRKGMLALFVFGLSFVGMIPGQDASAVTQYVYLYSTARGEYAWTCNVTTNLNKSSFAPGETATLYTAGSLSWDAGSDPGDGNCYTHYILNVGQTAPAFDGEAPGGLSEITSGTMTRGPAISHGFSGSANFTMPATLPNGSHYLRIYSTVSGDCNGDVAQPCSGTFRSDVDNLGFSIDPNICEWAQWFAPDASTWDTIGEGSLTPGQSITGQAGGGKHIFTCTGTGAAVCNINPGGDSGGSSRTVTATCTAPPSCAWSGWDTADVGPPAKCSGPSGTPTGPATACTVSNEGTTALGPCAGVYQRWVNTCSCGAAAPPSCAWSTTGYIDGRQPPGAAALHNSGRCSTPNPSDGTPLDSACNAGYAGGSAVCCDTGADCYRYSCSCGAAPPPSCTWQDIGYTNGFFEVQNNSRAEDVCDTTKPTWFLSNICPGTTTAGGVSLQPNGYRCYDSSTKFKGFAPTYEAGMCLAKAYRTVCTGSPTLIMTGTKYLGFAPDTVLGRFFAFVKNLFGSTAQASGPAVNIASGESVTLNWTTTGAATCTLTVPGQLPRAIAPAQIASGTTVVSGLPAGSHVISMTCADAAGTQTVMDTVVVIVAAAVPDLKICPRGSIPLSGNGGTTFLRAYYVPNGTVDCGNTSAAIDVTGTSAWSTSNAGVATVAAGVVTSTTNTAGSSATISATYLGLTDSGATVSITCVPTNSCASAGPAATAANRCPADTFTINDGCGGIVTCPGTRVCDFNWKEVGQ